MAHANAGTIIAEARRWIGTPYVHQASVRGTGCDCLGLIRGIWRAVIGPEPELPPAYTPDWGEVDRTEYVLLAAGRHLQPLPVSDARPGDVIVFRWRQRSIAKHMGILTAPAHLVHAWERVGVAEVALGKAWQRKIAGAFRFPQMQEDLR